MRSTFDPRAPSGDAASGDATPDATRFGSPTTIAVRMRL